MISFINEDYLKLVRDAWNYGDRVSTRNGIRRRVLGSHEKFTEAPLVSLRKVAWKNALREWEWFMSGSNFLSGLHPSVRHWWEPWADHNGVIWNNYSTQFRTFTYLAKKVEFFDQIEHTIKGIRSNPYDSRHVMTTWNPGEMALPETPIANCHGTVIQFFVDTQNRLTLQTYQRSCDLILGVPHNWIQYWAFLLWIAHRTGTMPHQMIWTGGDCHVYEAHGGHVEKLLNLHWLMVREYAKKKPELIYTPTGDEFKADDFTLHGEYEYVLDEKVELVV